jgi:3-oxoacyl-[acyl-carrier-protein] synthase-3
MKDLIRTVIIGTGSYLPERIFKNEAFLSNRFLDKNGQPIPKTNEAIVEKLGQISGIKERRYIGSEDTAEVAFRAAKKAIEDTGIDKESLDSVIVTHNFGQINNECKLTSLIPNVASLVKNRLQIKNHRCVAIDLLFGCPGWVESLIHAHRMILCGDARQVLVVGVEVISPILDKHNMDSMLFGDGAGAVVVKGVESDEQIGILGYTTYSHCGEEVDFLKMDNSVNGEKKAGIYPTMNGRQVYKYAVQKVPEVVNECLDKCQVKLEDVSKALLHQANEKMIRAILEKLYRQRGYDTFPESALPLTVSRFGNSSVATIPTLLDMILHDQLPPHKINSGDHLIFASVGAGMHANCLLYRMA